MKNSGNVIHAIVPAAGYGTRLLPASKSIPKEMFPILNKPAIEYIIDEIIKSNLKNLILITSKNKDSIINFFDNNFELEDVLIKKNKKKLLKSVTYFNNLNFINIRQKKALGLGHAIYKGKHVVNDRPFAVLLPDMIINEGHIHLNNMINIYNKTNKGVIALMEVPKNKVINYGIVDGIKQKDNTILIKNIVEKPSIEYAPTNLAVVGRYILPNRVFDLLGNIKPKENEEIQLTTALQGLADTDSLIGIVIKSKIHDIGTPSGFVEANISYGLSDSIYGDSIKRYIKSLKFQ